MTYLWEQSNQNALSFYFSVLTKVNCLYLAVWFFLNILTSLPVHIEYGGMEIYVQNPSRNFFRDLLICCSSFWK